MSAGAGRGGGPGSWRNRRDVPRGARLIRRLARLGYISGVSRVYLGHISPGAHDRRLRRVQVVRLGVGAVRRRVEGHAHSLRDASEMMPR